MTFSSLRLKLLLGKDLVSPLLYYFPLTINYIMFSVCTSWNLQQAILIELPDKEKETKTVDFTLVTLREIEGLNICSVWDN